MNIPRKAQDIQMDLTAALAREAALEDLVLRFIEQRDQMQATEAALREELATAKRNEHNSEVAYKAAIEKQEELREELAESGRADHLRARITFLTKEVHARAGERDTALYSLTAAEQRNAALIEAMERIRFRCESFSDEADGMKKYSVRTMLDIATRALKPTESGVSE